MIKLIINVRKELKK